jgi:hypothetical protein
MNMDISEQEIKTWWDEFERELATMVKPNDPNPPPKPSMEPPRLPSWKRGNTYYTLANDRQFPVELEHPNAVGWNYD